MLICMKVSHLELTGILLKNFAKVPTNEREVHYHWLKSYASWTLRTWCASFQGGFHNCFTTLDDGQLLLRLVHGLLFFQKIARSATTKSDLNIEFRERKHAVYVTGDMIIGITWIRYWWHVIAPRNDSRTFTFFEFIPLFVTRRRDIDSSNVSYRY